MGAEKVDPMNKKPNDYSLILFDNHSLLPCKYHPLAFQDQRL
jgi:hypothetical protein